MSKLLSELPEERPAPTDECIEFAKIANTPVGGVLSGTVTVVGDEIGIAYIRYSDDVAPASATRKHLGEAVFNRLQQGQTVRFRVNSANVVVELEVIE